MRLATGPHAPSMWRLPDTEIRSGGVEDDGDPVPKCHQLDVSQMGNVPSVTKTQADVRRVAPWQDREVRYVMPDQLYEPHLSNDPAAFYVVDHACLLQLDEGKTHGLLVGHP